MQREIKFRAWVKQDSEMKGYFIPHDSYELNYSELIDVHNENGCSVLQQFTGLTDKNGKEIYEGDILKERYYPLGSDKKVIEYYKIGVVVYHSPSFGLQLKFEGTNVLDYAKKSSHHRTEREVYRHPTAGENWVDKSFYGEIEIIGNIYETPELLK